MNALRSWQRLAAKVTWFYRWGPRDAWLLSKSRLHWWVEQAEEIKSGD